MCFKQRGPEVWRASAAAPGSSQLPLPPARAAPQRPTQCHGCLQESKVGDSRHERWLQLVRWWLPGKRVCRMPRGTQSHAGCLATRQAGPPATRPSCCSVSMCCAAWPNSWNRVSTSLQGGRGPARGASWRADRRACSLWLQVMATTNMHGCSAAGLPCCTAGRTINMHSCSAAGLPCCMAGRAHRKVMRLGLSPTGGVCGHNTRWDTEAVGGASCGFANLCSPQCKQQPSHPA